MWWWWWSDGGLSPFGYGLSFNLNLVLFGSCLGLIGHGIWGVNMSQNWELTVFFKQYN